jgi:hypothetical protein
VVGVIELAAKTMQLSKQGANGTKKTIITVLHIHGPSYSMSAGLGQFSCYKVDFLETRGIEGKIVFQCFKPGATSFYF